MPVYNTMNMLRTNLYPALLVMLLLFAACNGRNGKPLTPAQQEFENALAAMKKAGLVDTVNAATYTALVDKCRADSVNGIALLLEASGKSITLDMRLAGTGKMTAAYTAQHQLITSKFPEIKCDAIDLQYSIMDTTSRDTFAVMLKITKQQQTVERDLGLGYLPYARNVMDSAASKRLDPDFWKVYNRLLVETGSTKRLFAVPFRYNYEDDPKAPARLREDPEKLLLVLLDESQYNLLQPVNALEWDYNEFDLVSFSSCDAWLGKLQQCGLFTTDSFYTAGKKRELHANSLYSKQDFYDFFDTLFTTVSFDTLNDIDPFTTMYQNLNTISSGKLKLAAAEEVANAGLRIFSMRLQIGDTVLNRVYQQSNGMHDPNALEDVNIIIRALGREQEGLFYIVANTDNTVTVVYAPPALEAKIKASQLFDQFSEKVPEFFWRKYMPAGAK